MFEDSSFRIDKSTESRSDALLQHKLGEEIIEVCGVCNKCRQTVPLSKDDLERGYFDHTCSSDQPRTHLSERNKVKKKFFKFDSAELVKVVGNKLNSLDGIELNEQDRYWLVKKDNKTIPIFLLGIPQPVSYLYSGINGKSSAIFIYLEENQIKNFKTIFSENNFVKIDELIQNPEVIQSKLNALSLSFVKNEAISLASNIKELQATLMTEEFEAVFCDWFDQLKDHKEALERFLEKLNMDKINPCGAKYVKTGGNSPIDFENIQLFDYFNQALRVDPNKGYEVKAYADTTLFTLQKLKKKIDTTKGKDLLILVSTEKIESSVWREIFDFRKTNGYWKHIILDLDLIVLLVLGSATEDSFKKRPASI